MPHFSFPFLHHDDAAAPSKEGASDTRLQEGLAKSGKFDRMERSADRRIREETEAQFMNAHLSLAAQDAIREVADIRTLVASGLEALQGHGADVRVPSPLGATAGPTHDEAHIDRTLVRSVEDLHRVVKVLVEAIRNGPDATLDGVASEADTAVHAFNRSPRTSLDLSADPTLSAADINLDALQKEVMVLRDAAATHCDHIAVLKQQFWDSEKTVAELRAALSRSADGADRHSEAVARLREEVATLALKCEQLAAENARLQKVRIEEERTVTELRRTVVSLTQVRGELQAQLDETVQELGTVSSRATEAEDRVVRIGAAASVKESFLTDERHAAQAAARTFELAVEDLRNSIALLASELISVQHALSASQEGRTDVEGRLERARTELASMRWAHDSLQVSNTGLMQQLRKVTSVRDKLQAQLHEARGAMSAARSEFQAKIDAVEHDAQQADAARNNDLVTARYAGEVLAQKYAKLGTDYAQMVSTRDRQSSVIRGLEDELQAARDAGDRLAAKDAASRRQIHDMIAKQSEHRHYDEKVGHDLELTRGALRAMQTKYAEQADWVRALTVTRDEQQRYIGDLEAKLKLAQHATDYVSTLLQRLEESEAICKSQWISLRELQKDMTEAQHTSKRLATTNFELKTTVTEQTKEWAATRTTLQHELREMHLVRDGLIATLAVEVSAKGDAERRISRLEAANGELRQVVDGVWPELDAARGAQGALTLELHAAESETKVVRQRLAVVQRDLLETEEAAARQALESEQRALHACIECNEFRFRASQRPGPAIPSTSAHSHPMDAKTPPGQPPAPATVPPVAPRRTLRRESNVKTAEAKRIDGAKEPLMICQ